jgi:uncharacterized damage-inducible protein DinB
MADVSELFLQQSVSLLTRDYLPKLSRAVDVLTEADVWWRPNEHSNSIGNLLLHLRGNVTQWILGGVGGQPFTRERQGEFDAHDGPPVAQLLQDLTLTVEEACRVLARQNGTTLAGRRSSQGYEVSVLEAVYHVVEHFSMHTGQIILLAKARAGVDLALWQPRPSAGRLE